MTMGNDSAVVAATQAANWSAFMKRVLRDLPYFSLFTGAIYAAGRGYLSGYWSGVGLPLMDGYASVADVLYEGARAYFLLLANALDVVKLPVIFGILSLPLIGLAFHMQDRFKRHTESLVQQLLTPKLRAVKRKYGPAAESIAEAIDASEHYSAGVLRIARTALGVIAVILLAFTFANLANREGAIQGKGAVARRAAHLREIADGLVDVTVVRVRNPVDEHIEQGVPFSCEGDRCALMTAAGPISLPKDRFLEESVAKAVWDDTCQRAKPLQ